MNSVGKSVIGALLSKVLEQEGGNVTGRVVVAVLVLLGVVGPAFVAYVCSCSISS